MKKLVATILTAALIGSAGWSALWFAGRGAVAERLDVEISRLRAQGYQIEHGAREIGGFPFGYRVTHHDVVLRVPGNGATYRLPEISTELTAADIDRLIVRLPETYRIEVPMPQAQVSGPEMIGIDVESRDFVLIADGLLESGREVTLTATSLLVVTAGAEQALNLAVEFIGMEAVIALPPPSSGLPMTNRSTVDRLEYAYAHTSPDGVTASVEGSVAGLRLTGNTDISHQSDFLSLMQAGGGTSSFAYQTGASEGIVVTASGTEATNNAFVFSSGSTAGTLSLANGIAELNAASQANTVAFTIAGAGRASGIPGSFGAALRAIEMRYVMPLAPSDAMAGFVMRLALDQVQPDDALWTLIDADGTLPRDPARLMVDIEGTARLTGNLADQRPGAAPPVEIGNFSIKSADLSALGASLTARGDVEFLQPLNQPIGNVTVTLTNPIQLLEKLSIAGLIDPASAQTAMLMTTGFTVAGTGPGERIAEFAMSMEGTTLNGEPFGQ